MERYPREFSPAVPLFQPLIYSYIQTVIRLYRLLTARACALAAGRIFVCEVQSSAVDAENFWDRDKIATVVPVSGIFLSLAAKRIPAKKFAS